MQIHIEYNISFAIHSFPNIDSGGRGRCCSATRPARSARLPVYENLISNFQNEKFSFCTSAQTEMFRIPSAQRVSSVLVP